jgi:hypothetical protein
LLIETVFKVDEAMYHHGSGCCEANVIVQVFMHSFLRLSTLFVIS